MNEHLETLLRIKDVVDEAITIDERIRDWETKFSHHENPNYTALGAAVGELTGKFEYIKMLLDVYVTPLQLATAFATEFELELGKRQRLDPESCPWYNDGCISVEPIGDNGDDDEGFELIESRPSKNGVKRTVITDIGVMKVDGNWQIVNNLSPECRDKNENTPVDAEQLIDWMEGRE